MKKESISDFVSYNPATGSITWSETINSRIIKGNDACRIMRHHSGKEYLRVSAYQFNMLAHRVAWEVYYGSTPKGQIDHIDGNGKNNKIENLRCVTNQENHMNVKLQSNNRSGISGVCWDKSRGLWSVRIKYKRKNIYIKRTGDFFEACCLRKSAELKFGFHRNHGSQRCL